MGAAGLVGRVCVDVALSSGQPACLSPGLCKSELALSISGWGSVALQGEVPQGWQQEMSLPTW